MVWIKEVPLRRHALIVLVSAIAAIVAWLANVSLLLSLLSIVLIMKLFYQFELRFGMRESGPLSVIGANTIAIYTTHRILVELFSLTLIPNINHAARPAYAELALLLVYPFACLLLCTLFGLLVRKISQKQWPTCSFPRLHYRSFRANPNALLPHQGRINLLMRNDHG